MPAGDKIAVQVEGREVSLTNLAKVLYPADGFTKAEVLDYYQRISAVLLPHVKGRPMTLKRYPDGVDGQSFFAKHAPAGLPDWVRTGEIVSSSSRSKAPGEPIAHKSGISDVGRTRQKPIPATALREAHEPLMLEAASHRLAFVRSKKGVDGGIELLTGRGGEVAPQASGR